EAIKVLKAIGTQKSIPALEEAAADRDVFVQYAAKDALQVVRARRPGRGPSLLQAEATPATVELLPLGGVTVQAGQTRTVGVRLRRWHCPGPVQLRLENLPEG